MGKGPSRYLAVRLILLTLVVGGCARSDTVREPVEPTTQPALRPAEPITAAELWPAQAHAGRMKIVHGRGANTTFAFSMTPIDDGWQASDQGRRNTQYRRGQQGQVLLVREEEFGDNVIVEYDPPLPVLPARLEMNRPEQITSRMIVRDRTTGQVKHRGVVHYEVELLGRQDVRTPAGLFDAYIVRSTHDIRLDVANVQVTSFDAYVPGRGHVAQKLQRQTRALGLFGGDEVEETRLVE